MGRVALVVLLIVLVAPAVAGAGAGRARIAVLDTGIDLTHREFDGGQVVAWRDFVRGHPDPYDDHGHGTRTASLAAGNNRGGCASAPKLSFAPGAPLLVGKVLGADGFLPSSAMLAEAVDWAVDEGAAVISISIGSAGSIPPAADNPAVEDAFGRAAAAGVLVFVSAGNGRTHVSSVPEASTPWPSWARSSSNLADAIVVGSGPRSGISAPPRHNLDPDLASWGYGTCVPLGSGYGMGSGTSYSTPLVAGMAASAIDAAKAAGQPRDAARIERLLLLAASNHPAVPYAQEGMGFLLDAEWPVVRAHAQAGTLPDYDAQGPHAVGDRLQHDLVMPHVREPLTES